MDYAEFGDCLNWWNQREATANAWKATAADVLKYDADGKLLSVNLDIKNPNSLETLEHRPPEELIATLLQKEQQVLSIMEELRSMLGEQP